MPEGLVSDGEVRREVTQVMRSAGKVSKRWRGEEGVQTEVMRSAGRVCEQVSVGEFRMEVRQVMGSVGRASK